MRKATLFLRLLTGFILALLPLAGTPQAAVPSLPRVLQDDTATLYQEVQRGYVYRPAPAYRPPPVYRPAPRTTPRPSPNITRPAPRPNAVQPRPSTRQALPNQQRTPGTTVRPGTGSGKVLGAPIQRPRVFSPPRQQAQGGKPAPNVRKALPQTQKQTIRAKLERMRMAMRTKLERMRKGGGQGGKSGSGGSDAEGKPLANNGAGPPNRPRLTQVFNNSALGSGNKKEIHKRISFDVARKFGSNTRYFVTPGRNDRKAIIAASGTPDRAGFTKAGRSLQKHGDRQGSTFPKIKGSPHQANQQANSIVEDIVSNKNSKFQLRFLPRFGKVIEIRSPDGKGLRVDANNKELIGFLEPDKTPNG